MNKFTKETGFIKEESTWSVLEQLARQGAQKMLQFAIQRLKTGFKRHCLVTADIQAWSIAYLRAYQLAEYLQSVKRWLITRELSQLSIGGVLLKMNTLKKPVN